MFNDFTVEVADYQDFMDSLPAGSVDFILTDPPYCISKKNWIFGCRERCPTIRS